MSITERLCYEPADSSDIGPLFQFNRELIDAYEDKDHIDYDFVLSWVKNKLEMKITEYTRIMLDQKTIGYFHFHPENGEMELDDLYLFEPYRSQGVGTAVFRKCLSETDLPIFFYVFAKNERAVDLYKRMGFRITETLGTRYIMRNK